MPVAPAGASEPPIARSNVHAVVHRRVIRELERRHLPRPAAPEAWVRRSYDGGWLEGSRGRDRGQRRAIPSLPRVFVSPAAQASVGSGGKAGTRSGSRDRSDATTLSSHGSADTTGDETATREGQRGGGPVAAARLSAAEVAGFCLAHPTCRDFLRGAGSVNSADLIPASRVVCSVVCVSLLVCARASIPASERNGTNRWDGRTGQKRQGRRRRQRKQQQRRGSLARPRDSTAASPAPESRGRNRPCTIFRVLPVPPPFSAQLYRQERELLRELAEVDGALDRLDRDAKVINPQRARRALSLRGHWLVEA